jgi:lipopolysaccharide export system protein LptA
MREGTALRYAGLGLVVAFGLAGAALAQSAQFPFGGLKGDPNLPVEISSDTLSVNQTDNTATFEGSVVIGQGQMRLSAPKVVVEYGQDQNGAQATNKIRTLHATGGVTLVNGNEAAEGQEAVYTVASGSVLMTGSVVLTQGPNVISGDRLVVDLTSGTGHMEGHVRTIIKQQPQQPQPQQSGGN